MKSFVKYHLPVILYAALILAVSSIPNLRSPEVRFLAFDKLAHFCEYALFAYLAFRSTSHIGALTGRVRPVLVAFLMLALFALIDEGLQGFIPGRDSDVMDLVADLAGGGILLAVLWYLARRREQSERS